ncbi:hypothetical protein DS901_04565 [Loktanella sp. D2R18]|uniref:hypothetical protein n=1 Tax=Rhodobacterales TaxID=204455 RepID=UPI000DEABF3A|nr:MULTISPECIES: hypothetical protein [Rhodobacterales]MDO6589070.1 hypothetical protein [Yoonia sp. 1_MG-2023]RBW45492.1 hypothetical protein DS901_04565 [Loktanella sp. D2R18]
MMAKVFGDLFNLSRGGKALATAYAAIGATSAGMTLFVMSGNNAADVLARSPLGTEAGIVLTGAVSGLIALYLTRRWMGMPGKLGVARAMVGGCAMALVAAVIAGTLIAPLSGTVFAPIMLVAAFGLKPWLAAAWFGVVLMAHGLLARRTKGLREVTRKTDSTAIGQLSALSQANLYHKRNHLH